MSTTFDNDMTDYLRFFQIQEHIMKKNFRPSLLGRTPQQVREAQAAKEARQRSKQQSIKQNAKTFYGERILWTLLAVYSLFLILHIFNFTALCIERSGEKIVSEATILSTGDIILHSPFLESSAYITEDGSYNFDDIFTYIKEDYAEPDFTVVNLEVTLSDTGFYSGHPLFVSPYTLASTLKNASVDMCLLANNHVYDNSDEGMTMTMDILDENDLLHTGVRRSTDDITYSIQEINGIKVGILNYTFEMGSTDTVKKINTITVSSESAPLINSFNYEKMDEFYTSVEADLKEMKEAGAEFNIAYIHWGTEYQIVENETQQEMAQKLCDLGVDALIGSHPHVIQSVDLISSTSGDHKMLCAYSVGNHLSNQRKEIMDSCPGGYTEDGLMVNLALSKTKNGDIILSEAEFIPTWVYRENLDATSRAYYIIPIDASEEIVEKYDIETSLKESEDRTNSIIGEGVKKVQEALPLVY